MTLGKTAMIFKHLGNVINRFNDVLAEGNYRVPPMTWGRLIRGSLKPEIIPATSEVAVGTSMIDYGKSLGSKFMWGSVIALVSMTALKWAAIGFAAVGGAVYTAEYLRAKKSREDVIVEINFAGQRVKGKRADLYKLHRAQMNVMNISSSIDGATTSTTAEAVQAIMESVKEERNRVTVLDSGRYNAGKEAYAFSEPDFRIVLESAPLPQEPKAMPAPKEGSLRAAWENKRYTADEIADRFIALEEALPPETLEKVNQQRQKKAQPQPQP
jgi:hypothetical protein